MSEHPVTPLQAAVEPVEVVRSEDRLTTSTRWRRSGSVRIAKRVVEEERMITVRVRREELVVEELRAPALPATGERSAEDAGGATGSFEDAPPDTGAQPVVELVLSHEVVVPQLVVVADEVVRVHVDRVPGTRRVDVEVAREVVDLSVDTASGRLDPAGAPPSTGR